MTSEREFLSDNQPDGERDERQNNVHGRVAFHNRFRRREGSDKRANAQYQQNIADIAADDVSEGDVGDSGISSQNRGKRDSHFRRACAERDDR